MSKNNQQQTSPKKQNKKEKLIMLLPQIGNSQKGIDFKVTGHTFVTWTMNIFISKFSIMTHRFSLLNPMGTYMIKTKLL